jgi:hypothetical protein
MSNSSSNVSTTEEDQKEEELQELPFSEIHKQHKDMWVAVVVTKRDENLQPIAGKVVAIDPDRYRLRLNIVKYKEICIFYAGGPAYPLQM